ncbi:MAG: hypothetical protein ABWJ42_03395, partial [Sulfolobales archaeon]
MILLVYTMFNTQKQYKYSVLKASSQTLSEAIVIVYNLCKKVMRGTVSKTRENDFARIDLSRGQIELLREFPEEKYLWNRDFHPTPIEKRTWGALTYFWIWVSMVFIIPSWTLA